MLKSLYSIKNWFSRGLLALGRKKSLTSLKKENLILCKSTLFKYHERGIDNEEKNNSAASCSRYDGNSV